MDVLINHRNASFHVLVWRMFLMNVQRTTRCIECASVARRG